MVIDSITNYYIYLESAFYLKKQSLLNPNPVEVIRVFPVALRNFKIFRFPAKNEQMTKRKYHIYIYNFIAYLIPILNIYFFYRLREQTIKLKIRKLSYIAIIK